MRQHPIRRVNFGAAARLAPPVPHETACRPAVAQPCGPSGAGAPPSGQRIDQDIVTALCPLHQRER